MLAKETETQFISLFEVSYVPESDQNPFSTGAALNNELTEHVASKTRELRNKNDETIAIGVRPHSALCSS